MDRSKANFSQELPRFVVRYRKPITDSVINVVNLKKSLSSIEEKKLRRFFKCTQFNLRSDNRSDQCFATKNNKHAFEDHLKRKHNKKSFYCCYCNSRLNDENKKYFEADRLIIHMIVCHSNRRYQCNQCLYRAISAEHVTIHMSLIHSDIYKSTLNKKQLNGKMCRILECPPPTRESLKVRPPSVVMVYNRRKATRVNNDENHIKDYQCVYCQYMNERIPKVVEHCVQTHPDYYILYYVPDPLVTSTHSPPRRQTYSDIDMFQNSRETQDNRISSTREASTRDPKAIRTEHIDGFDGFKKKVRISTVPQKSSSQSMSSKRVNKYQSQKSPFVKRRSPAFPSSLHKLGAAFSKRMNHLPSSQRSSTKKARFDVSSVPKKAISAPKPTKVHKLYESESSDEEIPYSPPKRVPKIVAKTPERRAPSPQYNAKHYESNDMNRPSTSSSRKTTTIEIAEPESSSQEEDEVHEEVMEVEEMSHYICFFCDKTFDNRNVAIDHLERHIPDINDVMYDIEESSEVTNWFHTFIDKQMSLFEEERNVDDIGYHLKCPLCMKIARIRKLRPKGFRTLWEVRSHVWEHSLWTPVKCLKCGSVTSDHFLPNCDHLIAKHLNAKHSKKLSANSNPNIRGVFGNKAKLGFSFMQRRALTNEKFIDVKPFGPLDKQIEVLLNEVNAQNEAHLREKIAIEKNTWIHLPNLVLEPLPPLNFEDDQMVIDFIQRTEGINRSQQRERNVSHSQTSAKVLDILDIRSSSDEDSDALPSIHTYSGTKKPRKRITTLDSDDESDTQERQTSHQSIAHNNEDTSDDSIEVVEPPDRPNTPSSSSSECEFSIDGLAPEPGPSNGRTTPVRNFECGHCKQRFDSKNAVKTHSKQKHLSVAFKRV